MITQPLLYLFTLASIATLFYLLESKTSLKIFNSISSLLFIYTLSMLFTSVGIFEFNEEIKQIFFKTTINLLPAMLFLMLLQMNFRELLKFEKLFKQRVYGIGCACSMGAKRYWFLILLSLGISFFIQLLAFHFTLINRTITVIFFALLFGFLGSFTSLKKLNGSKEVAKSMLYLSVALLGSYFSL